MRICFKGYQTGAVDYIYKPINPDLLRAKVGVFIDLYKKTRLLLTGTKTDRHQQKPGNGNQGTESF